MTADGMIELYQSLLDQFPVVSIEDPFDQDDWENTAKLTQLDRCQVVGDDLLATNRRRVTKAVEQTACNAATIKPTQVGTITETIAAATTARAAGWDLVVSHRGADTDD